MIQEVNKLSAKPQNSAKLKIVLQTIWDNPMKQCANLS